ncbi:hypothetical protein AURDEDRAFT_164182 [Auricularia subglabra TFB-10046 SS5]|nr:hypothetical protein AURDEDRAFT_164182 [Auricularia subglabra TFB-10046 SS5]
MQAASDSHGNQLVANRAAITELKTSLNSHQARSKVQHDVVTRQLTASNKEVAAVNLKYTILSSEMQGLRKDFAVAARSHDTTRADIERLIDKWRVMDGIISQLRSTAEGLGTSAFAPDFMDSLDATTTQLRMQLDEALDLVSNLRARIEALEVDVATARSEAAEANAMAARALDEVRRLANRLDRSDRTDDARPRPARALEDPPRRPSTIPARESTASTMPPPAAGSVRRRGSLSGSDTEDARTFKAPRVSDSRSDRWHAPPDDYSRTPSFEGYHSYGTRDSRDARAAADPEIRYDADAARPADAAPLDELDAIPSSWTSMHVGADPKKQVIHWGRRNEPHVAVKTVTRWALHLDGSGAIPIPTRAAAPPGMADNYRLITFHTHADLVAFLRAWQTRTDELRDVIATPVAETAGTSASSTAASLGLHPPGSNDNAGARRASGSKDPQGRRHF